MAIMGMVMLTTMLALTQMKFESYTHTDDTDALEQC